MPDAVEAVWEGVEQEAADELIGAQGHELGLTILTIVFPGEADLAVFEADQAAVGNGDAVSVAAEIGQDLFWSAEGSLGVDDPVDLARPGEVATEGGRFGEAGEVAKEPQACGVEGGLQAFQEQPAEQAREHAHRQEEAGAAGDPAFTVQ